MRLFLIPSFMSLIVQWMLSEDDLHHTEKIKYAAVTIHKYLFRLTQSLALTPKIAIQFYVHTHTITKGYPN